MCFVNFHIYFVSRPHKYQSNYNQMFVVSFFKIFFGDPLTSNTIPFDVMLGFIFSTDQSWMSQELLSDWSIYLTAVLYKDE